jgi:hypothetical protein
MNTLQLIEGPFGIRMKDATALAVESLLKTLPKECREVLRKAAVPESTEFLFGERADISLVSAETVDRDGDVVIAKGMNLEFFRQNPVVTLAHKYDELPVGRAQWIKAVVRGIKAKTIYSKTPDEWQGPYLPEAVWQMTREGILRGKSIGFLPTKLRPPTSKESGVWKDVQAVIESAVLLEYAVAPVPCNQDALVEAVAKGYADEATLKRLGLSIERPKEIRRHFDRHAATIKALANIDADRIAEAVLRRIMDRGKV